MPQLLGSRDELCPVYISDPQSCMSINFGFMSLSFTVVIQFACSLHWECNSLRIIINSISLFTELLYLIFLYVLLSPEVNSWDKTVAVVQSLSRVWLFVTSWTTARQASLSFTISQSLLKFISIKLVIPSNHLILCHSLLLLSSVFPSIRVFSNDSALCIRWPKCWSFSFSIHPSNEYSGLISLRTDWFDLLAVQGTLKSLLQHLLQFKGISSSVLSLFYCPVLTSVHAYWKNHSFD